MGTWVIVAYGGLRLRSRPHQIAAVLYLATTIGSFVVAAMSTTPQGTMPDGSPDYVMTSPWVSLMMFLPFFLGLVHVLWLQLAVQSQSTPSNPTPWAPPRADPAIMAAHWRAHRRQEARQLLAAQPALAAELRIGRPDVPHRQYDDGGLIDVNHLSAQWLAHALEMTPEQAADVVARRETLGGFTSPDELVVYCNTMTPQRLDVIRDRLVFVPR